MNIRKFGGVILFYLFEKYKKGEIGGTNKLNMEGLTDFLFIYFFKNSFLSYIRVWVVRQFWVRGGRKPLE